MSLLNSADRKCAEAIASLGYCNPFLPERIELEREILGTAYVEQAAFRHQRAELSVDELFVNVGPIATRAGELLTRMRKKLLDGASAFAEDLLVYEDLALVELYLRFMSNWRGLVTKELEGHVATKRIRLWRDFESEFRHYLNLPGVMLPSAYEPAHAFACFYQIERAYQHIFEKIIGGSMPAARLRAAVWQSIFTHDMRRYARGLYRHMGQVPTLITGPSGSGKELVARAIGLSRYIEFRSESESFDDESSFHAVNLAALAPTLIESELFGHVKHAFTGAGKDRQGLFQICSNRGTVFLDEIGEVEPAIQVKLLRVLQEGEFQRLGETIRQMFAGKIIAATNRNLAAEMRAGKFREDLYYRLCADIVRTPSLHEQLVDSPGDLRNVVGFVTKGVVADDASEQEALTEEVVRWIEQQLGEAYPWPGNFRELEQCVRNVMIRSEYHPPQLNSGSSEAELTKRFLAGELTTDELLCHYYELVYRQTGSFKAAGKQLGVDRRTVKSRVESAAINGGIIGSV